ncbi:hypothetical protein PB01_00980 [Psychrobacillus glaciei]|uniref:Uncharacterized protein n=1 Tax=Psychrobacillus glaciei TaxID=2283160 RepID=A0A5J6SI85_9BACI|nr:hypothetical protein [Psychrobacillus glaciei]QFF97498.1 hypothetical protein PB01_00980 [Psychrobacillus glaciei]
MKKQNTLFILFYLILLLLIVGCTNKNVPSDDFENDISKLENKIVELNQAVEKQRFLLEEQEKKIMLNEMKMETVEELNTVLHNNFHSMNELINLSIDSKTAMLNSAEIKGNTLNLNITFTEKIMDQDAPNGFHLEETEGGAITLSISENVPICLVKGGSSLIQVDWEEVVIHRGLLQLYEKDGEVVFISEIYLP